MCGWGAHGKVAHDGVRCFVGLCILEAQFLRISRADPYGFGLLRRSEDTLQRERHFRRLLPDKVFLLWTGAHVDIIVWVSPLCVKDAIPFDIREYIRIMPLASFPIA